MNIGEVLGDLLLFFGDFLQFFIVCISNMTVFGSISLFNLSSCMRINFGLVAKFVGYHVAK